MLLAAMFCYAFSYQLSQKPQRLCMPKCKEEFWVWFEILHLILSIDVWLETPNIILSTYVSYHDHVLLLVLNSRN